MGNSCLMSSVSGDTKVLELDRGGDGCLTMQMYLMPLNGKLESGLNGQVYATCVLRR